MLEPILLAASSFFQVSRSSINKQSATKNSLARFLQPSNASIIQTRSLFVVNKGKEARRKKLRKQRKRDGAILHRDWPIKVGDSVFVLGKDYKLGNPEILDSPEQVADFLGGEMETLGELGEVEELHKLEDCVTVKGVNEGDVDTYNIYTGAMKNETLPLPVAYSRVFLVDPVDGMPTLTKYMYDQETGEKYRVSNRTQEIIAWPTKDEGKVETHFNDTLPEDVAEDTYSTTPPFNYDEWTKKLDEKSKERKERRLQSNMRLAEQKRQEAENKDSLDYSSNST